MDERIRQIAEICIEGGFPDRGQVESLLDGADLYDLLYWSNRIRERFFGVAVQICAIVPGRLGGCNQDCRFCAQSARYNSGFVKPEVMSDEQIMAAAKEAEGSGLKRFGIVYSGKSISEEELSRLEVLIGAISKMGLEICGSLGVIDSDQAQRLVKAGLRGYNHNLETSENHFSNIVTTHEYGDRVRTIRIASQAGLRICAGGIFGIGESEADRVDMAMELRDLKVDTVPMNFLHPIEGTPLGDMKTLEPGEILRIIAMYRFILPQTTLKVAGGRVLNMRDMQSWIFYAGANAILSGNYLTTAGRSVEDDLRMISDLGLRAEVNR